jgi:hypothetical protein
VHPNVNEVIFPNANFQNHVLFSVKMTYGSGHCHVKMKHGMSKQGVRFKSLNSLPTKGKGQYTTASYPSSDVSCGRLHGAACHESKSNLMGTKLDKVL